MCEYIILEDLLYGQVHFESMEGITELDYFYS